MDKTFIWPNIHVMFVEQFLFWVLIIHLSAGEIGGYLPNCFVAQ